MAKRKARIEDTEIATMERDEVAMVRVPLGEINPDHNLSRMISTGHLSHLQRVGLRRAFIGMQGRKAQLENGRTVRADGDVIRWILEQLGVA